MKKVLDSKWFSLILISMFLACNNPMPVTEVTADPEAEKQIVIELERVWNDAFNNRDLEGIMAYYAEDAESYPPAQTAKIGKAAIREMMAEFISTDTTGFKITIVNQNVNVSGDLAVETGGMELSLPDGSKIGTSKYVVVFRKTDGIWKNIREIWNDDSAEK